ncbi:hypothetical protein EDD11_010409 [Mortierella claussenii]|nr:hypothetical protein EDD11_010409 [Mortierella claussenii]
MEVTVKHPNLQQTYKPLIRSVSDLGVPVVADTISNHIHKVSNLMPLPARAKRHPSGRSIGVSLAIQNGASIGDVQVHGFWSSPAIIDNHYRLLRRPRVDLTRLALN